MDSFLALLNALVHKGWNSQDALPSHPNFYFYYGSSPKPFRPSSNATSSRKSHGPPLPSQNLLDLTQSTKSQQHQSVSFPKGRQLPSPLCSQPTPLAYSEHSPGMPSHSRPRKYLLHGRQVGGHKTVCLICLYSLSLVQVCTESACSRRIWDSVAGRGSELVLSHLETAKFPSQRLFVPHLHFTPKYLIVWVSVVWVAR